MTSRVEPRHARQAKLAEVGPVGQARIAATHAVVHGEGLAARVAARYLAGAGVRSITVTDAAAARAASEVDGRVEVHVEPRPGGASDDPRLARFSPACRAVALGSLHALAVLRSAVSRDRDA